jgi:hypothetical protein
VKDICRKNAISDATYYNRKARYGGLGDSELKQPLASFRIATICASVGGSYATKNRGCVSLIL